MASKKKIVRKTAKRKPAAKLVAITLVQGEEREYQIKSGTTLEAFMAQNGLEGNARVNGNEADGSEKLRKGDLVTIVPDVQGGVSA